MSDARSRRCIFVSHCVLAQCVMAEGLVRNYRAAVKPVVEFCLAHDINIMQMPCPETLCASGGLGRRPHGKTWYEQHGLRETAAAIARGQAEYVGRLVESGMEVLGVVGVDFSPACAVNYLNKGRAVVRGEGIYFEELKRELHARGVSLPFIGISPRWKRKMARDLISLLASPAASPPVLEQVQ